MARFPPAAVLTELRQRIGLNMSGVPAAGQTIALRAHVLEVLLHERSVGVPVRALDHRNVQHGEVIEGAPSNGPQGI